MQIKINLLPPEIQAQIHNKRRQKITGLAGAILLFFMLGVYVALVAATHNLDKQIVALKNDKQILQQEIASYKTYQDLQAKTNKTNQLVQTITGSSPDFIRLLEGISQTIPHNVWLTELVTSSTKNTPKEATDDQKQHTSVFGEVILRGNGLDHAAVADWLQELPNISVLTDVRLHTTNEENAAGPPVTRFEIKATLKVGGNNTGLVEKAGD